MSSRTKFVVVMSSTCLVALLLLGAVVSKGAPAEGESPAVVADNNVYKHLEVYSEVLSRIKSEYVEEPNMSSVTLGAMNGLLESIDPYASYLNAEQYKEYLKNYDTYRGSLGMVLAKKFGYVTVVSVVPGSPAAKVGLTTGDMLESIKGIATRDMPLAYAQLLLKGQPGSTVEMSVLRRKPEPQKLTLTREVVVFPPVESKLLPDAIGYIKIPSMSHGDVKEVAAAVASLEKQGAKKLILDVRYSASGTPEDGIDLANLFLNKGLITYTQGQKWPRKNFDADPSKDITSLPLIVMTNHGTAGAAELAAGALQGDKRASLVGERTYGDASVLRPISMDDGSAIILSVAKYYTPDGKSIQDNGVTPGEIVIEPDPTTDDGPDPSQASPSVAAPLRPVSRLPDGSKAQANPDADKSPVDDPILQKAIQLAQSK